MTRSSMISSFPSGSRRWTRFHIRSDSLVGSGCAGRQGQFGSISAYKDGLGEKGDVVGGGSDGADELGDLVTLTVVGDVGRDDLAD